VLFSIVLDRSGPGSKPRSGTGSDRSRQEKKFFLEGAGGLEIFRFSSWPARGV
jgi:hypothetical protein